MKTEDKTESIEEIFEKMNSEVKKIEKKLLVLQKSEYPFEHFTKFSVDPFSEIKTLVGDHDISEIDDEEYKTKFLELSSICSKLKEEFQFLIKGETFILDENFSIEDKKLEKLTDKEWIQVSYLIFCEPDILKEEPFKSFELDCDKIFPEGKIPFLSRYDPDHFEEYLKLFLSISKIKNFDVYKFKLSQGIPFNILQMAVTSTLFSKEILELMISNFKIDIHEPNKLGYTPIYYVNSSNNLNVLLDFDVDPFFESNDSEFKNPLHYIICNSRYGDYSDQIEIFKTFYDHGFDFEKRIEYHEKNMNYFDLIDELDPFHQQKNELQDYITAQIQLKLPKYIQNVQKELKDMKNDIVDIKSQMNDLSEIMCEILSLVKK
eukprot:gene4840-8425_t